VRTHDFMDKDLGKAIPYGVYDVAASAGWVNVGTDHDTAAFAVESIRRWWTAMGRAAYPRARRLLVTAGAGGSNSDRTRAWKAELAAFALETGLAVTVCHFPPGTSKWNKCVWPGGRPGVMKCGRGARRARSPSRQWSAESPQQVWRRTRGTWDCRCEHEPQIRLGTRSSPAGSPPQPPEEETWNRSTPGWPAWMCTATR
jgi:hypothetical protein